MISETELLKLMDSNGFTEFVYDWNLEQEVFAVGMESHSVLFLSRFNRVAIWYKATPNRIRWYSPQEWSAMDETDMGYLNIELSWWAQFKPVFLEVTSHYPSDQLPSGCLKWVRSLRNVRWCNGVKVKRIRPVPA